MPHDRAQKVLLQFPPKKTETAGLLFGKGLAEVMVSWRHYGARPHCLHSDLF